jgi:hypothetical protein
MCYTIYYACLNSIYLYLYINVNTKPVKINMNNNIKQYVYPNILLDIIKNNIKTHKHFYLLEI